MSDPVKEFGTRLEAIRKDNGELSGEFWNELYGAVMGERDPILSERQKKAIQSGFFKLDERERFVIAVRFGLFGEVKLKLREAGVVLGVTKERVRQIESRGLRRVRYQYAFAVREESRLDALEADLPALIEEATVHLAQLKARLAELKARHD